MKRFAGDDVKLLNFSLPVPTGFTISTTAYDSFVASGPATRIEDALARQRRAKERFLASPVGVAKPAGGRQLREMLGRDDEVRKAVGRLHQIDPTSGVSNFAHMWPLRRPEDLAAFDSALHLTGLPE